MYLLSFLTLLRNDVFNSEKKVHTFFTVKKYKECLKLPHRWRGNFNFENFCKAEILAYSLRFFTSLQNRFEEQSQMPHRWRGICDFEFFC